MTSGPSRRRPVVAAVTGIVVLALCAVPLFWTAAFSVAGFTGCFLDCNEPEPAVGMLWGSIALLLAAAPVLAAALAGGYQVRVALPTAAVVSAGLLAVVVLGLTSV